MVTFKPISLIQFEYNGHLYVPQWRVSLFTLRKSLLFHFVPLALSPFSVTGDLEIREMCTPKSGRVTKIFECTIEQTVIGLSNIVRYFLQFASRILWVLPGIKVLYLKWNGTYNCMVPCLPFGNDLLSSPSQHYCPRTVKPNVPNQKLISVLPLWLINLKYLPHSSVLCYLQIFINGGILVLSLFFLCKIIRFFW